MPWSRLNLESQGKALKEMDQDRARVIAATPMSYIKRVYSHYDCIAFPNLKQLIQAFPRSVPPLPFL